jgi:hypothetical protein
MKVHSHFVLFGVAPIFLVLFVENTGLGWACNFVMTSRDVSFKYHMNNLSLCDEFLGHNLPFDVFTMCSSFVGPMKCFCECKCCFRLRFG